MSADGIMARFVTCVLISQHRLYVYTLKYKSIQGLIIYSVIHKKRQKKNLLTLWPYGIWKDYQFHQFIMLLRYVKDISKNASLCVAIFKKIRNKLYWLFQEAIVIMLKIMNIEFMFVLAIELQKDLPKN